MQQAIMASGSTLADQAARAVGRRIGSSLSSTFSRGRSLSRDTSRRRSRSRSSARSNFEDFGQHSDLSVRKLPNLVIRRNRYKSDGEYVFRHWRQRVMISSQGSQLADYITPMLTRDQIFGLNLTNDRSFRENWDTSPFLLNPFVNAIAPSTIYPGPVAVPFDEQKIGIKYIDHEVNVLGLTTEAQLVDIYWVMPRYDTPDAPTVVWNRAVSSKNLTQVPIDPATTIADQTAVSGQDNALRWGNIPTQYKDFRKHYKLLRKVSFVLKPGDQRNFKFRITNQRIIPYNTLWTREDMYMAGITIVPMFVARSALVGVSPTTESGVLEVAHGVAKIGVASNNVYHFAAVKADLISTNRVFPGMVLGDTTDSMKIIDDEDNIEPVQVA